MKLCFVVLACLAASAIAAPASVEKDVEKKIPVEVKHIELDNTLKGDVKKPEESNVTPAAVKAEPKIDESKSEEKKPEVKDEVKAAVEPESEKKVEEVKAVVAEAPAKTAAKEEAKEETKSAEPAAEKKESNDASKPADEKENNELKPAESKSEEVTAEAPSTEESQTENASGADGTVKPVAAEGRAALTPESRRTGKKYKDIQIIQLESEIQDNGKYRYNFETEDGTSVNQEGEMKMMEDEHMAETVKGGYTYTDDDGKTFSITYVADENGFRPVGDHIPTPPPIPKEIAESLARQATAKPWVDPWAVEQEKLRAARRQAKSAKIEEVEATDKVESKPVDAETKAEVKVESKPVEAEAKAEAKTEAKAEVKAEAKADIKAVRAKIEAKTDA